MVLFYNGWGDARRVNLHGRFITADAHRYLSEVAAVHTLRYLMEWYDKSGGGESKVKTCEIFADDYRIMRNLTKWLHGLTSNLNT